MECFIFQIQISVKSKATQIHGGNAMHRLQSLQLSPTTTTHIHTPILIQWLVKEFCISSPYPTAFEAVPNSNNNLPKSKWCFGLGINSTYLQEDKAFQFYLSDTLKYYLFDLLLVFIIIQVKLFIAEWNDAKPVIVAVGLSGILKVKQKLGVTFNSDKLGGWCTVGWP